MADEIAAGIEPAAEKPKYDQAFFLALAAAGKDAWNAWRRDPANNDVCVTFAGVDFYEAPKDQINFSGYEFGDVADFSGCKRGGTREKNISEAFELLAPNFHKPGRASFTCAAFGHSANFSGSVFGTKATFAGAEFNSYADFTASAFSEVVDFKGAIFGPRADFTGVSFFDAANFHVATFGNETRFMNVVFRDLAEFGGAAFGSGILFSRTSFGDDADFMGKSPDQWDATLEALFPWMDKETFNVLKERHKASWRRNGSGPNCFFAVWFSGTSFNGESNFSDRSFQRSVDFSGACFGSVAKLQPGHS